MKTFKKESFDLSLRCAGVSMVRNEADVIELWARYNLRALDSLHVIDHGSEDNTVVILQQLQAEGLIERLRGEVYRLPRRS